MPETKAYIHAATSLQLKSWRYLFAFLRASGKVRKRLSETPGSVQYKLRANFFRKTFRTYSIYESYEALQDVIYSPEHAEAMQKMNEWSGPESRNAHWTSPSREIDWEEGLRRLAEAPSHAEKQARARSGVQIAV